LRGTLAAVPVLADALVLACALLFLAMGLYALAQPAAVVARFGIRVESAAGRNEVRAVYGGFGIAVAAMLAYAALTTGRGAFWIPSVIALAMIGMAVGRLASVALDRDRGSGQVWLFFCVEVALAAALFGSHALR
jgi:uncharacterized protein DUF4345